MTSFGQCVRKDGDRCRSDRMRVVTVTLVSCSEEKMLAVGSTAMS